MNPPLFSQIPSIVLNKFATPGVRTKKVVSFYDDVVKEARFEEQEREQVSSSWSSQEQNIEDDHDVIELDDTGEEDEVSESKELELSTQCAKRKNHSNEEDKPELIILAKETSDAIVQVEKPELVSTETQTDICLSDFLLLKDHQNHSQNESVGYKPMYAIPKKEDGEQPPLKIGLSIPGGRRKRKVFYPDDEDG